MIKVNITYYNILDEVDGLKTYRSELVARNKDHRILFRCPLIRGPLFISLFVLI